MTSSRPARASSRSGKGGASRVRRRALRVLLQVARGRRLDRALADAMPGLRDEERRQLQNATYGTVRARGRLDARLAPLLNRPLDSLDPEVREALRLGAHEILEAEGTPPYAAVSEAVALVREGGGKGGAGLVNAVLRRLVRSEAPPSPSDPEERLSTEGSHPRWLVRRWLARYGAAETERIVRAGNQRPSLFLRPLGVSSSRLVERLRERGIEARPVAVSPLVELPPGTSPTRALEAAPAQVQDPAASLVADFVAPPPHSVVADLCAAPGGKALALAASGRPRRVLAADLAPARLRLVAEGARRTGIPLSLVVSRAEAPPIRGVDVVLLDVPCSGTGTLARHPDARWRLTPEDPGRMAELQGRMLDAAADAVGPGGLVVYATCSLEPEENEGVVEAFLERRRDVRPEEPPAGAFPLDDTELEGVDRNETGRLRVLPRAGCQDGAFAVRLRKEGPRGPEGGMETQREGW